MAWSPTSPWSLGESTNPITPRTREISRYGKQYRAARQYPGEWRGKIDAKFGKLTSGKVIDSDKLEGLDVADLAYYTMSLVLEFKDDAAMNRTGIPVSVPLFFEA